MRSAQCCALVVMVLASLFATACSEEPYELFTLQEVRPSRIEPGHRMVILGAGFPIGREVEVVFRGTVHAPLGAARQVEIQTHGHTDSPERVVTALTESDMSQVGQRGTFDGTIEVSLHGSVLEGRSARVFGRLENVTLDIVAGEPLSLVETDGGSLDAQRALGLSVEGHGEQDSPDAEEGDEGDEGDGSETMARQTPRGLLIRGSEGLSAGAGVRPGDRLLRIDHLRPLFPHELRVPHDAPFTVLEVERAGQTREVRIQLSTASEQGDRASFRYDQIAAIILAVALLFGTRRWAPLVSSLEPSESKRMVGRFILGLVALASALLIGVLPLPLGTLLLGAALLRTIVGIFAMRGRRSEEALHEAVLLLASSLGLVVSVLVFAALSGSLDAASSHTTASRTETLLPLYWTLARHPFGPLALGLLLASATGAPLGASHPSTQRERLLRGLDDLALALFALAFVRVSIANPAQADVTARALGLLATTALTLALVHVRQTMSRLRGRLRVVLGLALGTTLTAYAWTQHATSRFEEQAVAEVVLVVLALATVRIASLRQPERAHERSASTPARDLPPPRPARA